MKKIIYFLLCILLFTSMFATSVFAYSPQKAITYSNTYAINPNKMNTLGVGYNVYSRDCTNFVSQCYMHDVILRFQMESIQLASVIQ